MPRRRKRARIGYRFGKICFKPCGMPRYNIDKVTLSYDELEAIRLADLEGMYQQDASQLMNVSRPTFSRIIERAHQKIAEALIHSKAIEIEDHKDE